MEILIDSVLNAVFASLAEAVGLSDWLRDRLERDPEKLAFRTALTKALADAGERFSGRDLRYFAELLRDFGGPLLARSLQPAASFPSAVELTEAWLGHLNLDSLLYYKADFEHFATIFLESLHSDLGKQQPLQWIAQLRTQKITVAAARRSAEVAEQSAELLMALRDELHQLNQRLERQSHLHSSGGAVIEGNVRAGRNVVGRDYITIRNYFTNGLGRLHIDYSSRIEEFLQEYLGSRRKRVPFGGRTIQLAELTTWLHDRLAPPYYLMTSEAGRGKSALVCRWQAHVMTLPNVEVVFIPISIRFETATQDVIFALMAARLAVIYGEKIQAAALSSDQWRAVCQSYLRRQPPDGKQLVIILDGLDEAIGWNLGRGFFPSDPSEGLRVLVTARPRVGGVDRQGWAVVLGWENKRLARKAMLPRLDQDGIREALTSIGSPLDIIAARTDMVGELYHLSEGDPLLVKLYVDALADKIKETSYLRIEELQALQPGLDGYFDGWWREQHQQWENEGRDPILEHEKLLVLLSVMAAALGPLTLNDLANVSELSNGLLVHRLVQIAGRWLIGDGNEQGYAFSHPRLGYYFWDRMGRNEQHTWDTRFCSWGNRILDALNDKTDPLKPKDAPRYLVQYYSAHLKRSGAAPEYFYALISNGWRQAWEVLDISNAGFTNDIDCAWEQAQQAYDLAKPGRYKHLAQQLKAAICHASLSSLHNSLPPSLLVESIQSGIFSSIQALAIAKIISDEKERSEALTALLPVLEDELYKEVLPAIKVINDSYAKANVLKTIIPYLPLPMLNEALSVALTISSEYEQLPVLAVLIGHLPEYEQNSILTRVWAFIQTMTYESSKVDLLIKFASYFTEHPQKLTQILIFTQKLSDRFERIRLSAALLPYLSEPERSEICSQALTDSQQLSDIPLRLKIFTSLTPYLSEAQRSQVLAQNLTDIQRIDDVNEKISVLIEYISYFSEVQRSQILAQVLTDIQTISSTVNKVMALARLIPYLSEAQRSQILAHAITDIQAIDDVKFKAEAFAKIIPYLSEPESDQTLTQIFIELQTINYNIIEADILIKLIPYLGQLRRSLVIARVLLIAINYGGNPECLWILTKLLPYLQEPEKSLAFAQVSNTIQKIVGTHYLTGSALEIVPHLPVPQIQEMFDAIQTLSKFYRVDKIRALITLASHLPSNMLVHTITIARQIDDESNYDEVLTILAPYLPASLLGKVLLTFQNMTSVSKSVHTLTKLIPHLPKALHSEALSVIQTFQDDSNKLEALLVLMPFLSASLHSEALVIVQTIKSESSKVEVLKALNLSLSDTNRNEAFIRGLIGKEWKTLLPHLPDSLLTLALAIADMQSDSGALVALISRLPDSLLILALTIADKQSNSDALIALIPRLPVTLLNEVLIIINRQRKGYRFSQFDVLIALIPYLSKSEQAQIVDQAFALLQADHDESGRIKKLTALAPYLTELFYSKALSIALNINYEYGLTTLLAVLIRQLPESDQNNMVVQTLTTTVEIQPERKQTWILTVLAPYLSAPLYKKAWDIIQGMRSYESRIPALKALAPYLPAPQHKRALAIVRTVKRKPEYLATVGAFAHYLPEPEREQILSQALSLAQELVGGTYPEANALKEVACHLSHDLLRTALARILPIYDEYSRVSKLEILIPYLPAPFLNEVLTASRAIKDDNYRKILLIALAHYLPVTSLNEVLKDTQSIRTYQAEILTALAPRLPITLFDEALDIIKSIPYESGRVESFSAFIPRLPFSLFSRAMMCALTIENQEPINKLLITLVPNLINWAASSNNSAYGWLSVALRLLSRSPRPQFLSNLKILMPFILALAGDEAEQTAADILQTIQEVRIWWL